MYQNAGTDLSKLGRNHNSSAAVFDLNIDLNSELTFEPNCLIFISTYIYIGQYT